MTVEALETLLGQRDALARREVGAVELVERSLARIEAIAPLNAFLTVVAERALDEARRHDAAGPGGSRGALAGVPIAVKDLEDTAGVRTTYGSVRFADHVPDVDSAVVARLRAAGAIVVGKTNTPAFGLISETKNRLAPPCANPHDPARTAGGSSGGSAVAVATGAVALATGSDAAGSINVPAAFCGVVGMKPSVGLVPHVPPSPALMPLISVGPLTTNVDDAALALGVMAGYDPRDPMSRPAPATDRLAAARAGLPEGLRVAWSSEVGGAVVDHAVARASAAAAAALAEAGCLVRDDAPDLEDPMGLYLDLYVTDSRQAGFSDPATWGELYPESLVELRDRPALSGEEYARVLNRWWRYRAAWAEFFTRHDLLVAPTTACTAFAHDTMPTTLGGRPVEAVWTTWMPFTPLFNLTGQPCASVPYGVDPGGLPIGVMVVGAPGADDLVLAAARSLLGR